MSAIEAKTCVVCFNPIEKARLEVLGTSTSICAKCAHARSSPLIHSGYGYAGTKQLTFGVGIDANAKRKEKKERVDNRILRSVIWDGFPRQVTVPCAYVMEDIYLEIVPDGEIWSRTILIGA